MRKLLYIATILSMLSCKTIREVEKEYVYKTDTLYQTNVKYDSISYHDSIFMLVKGDTIIKYVEKDRFKYIYKTDTIVKTETVTIDMEFEKEVEKPLTFWQKIKQGTWSALAILCAILGICLWWKMRK